MGLLILKSVSMSSRSRWAIMFLFSLAAAFLITATFAASVSGDRKLPLVLLVTLDILDTPDLDDLLLTTLFVDFPPRGTSCNCVVFAVLTFRNRFIMC